MESKRQYLEQAAGFTDRYEQAIEEAEGASDAAMSLAEDLLEYHRKLQETGRGPHGHGHEHIHGNGLGIGEDGLAAPGEAARRSVAAGRSGGLESLISTN